MDVFGTDYGIARETLVRKAARQLQADNRVQLDATAKHPRDWEIWL